MEARPADPTPSAAAMLSSRVTRMDRSRRRWLATSDRGDGPCGRPPGVARRRFRGLPKKGPTSERCAASEGVPAGSSSTTDEAGADDDVGERHHDRIDDRGQHIRGTHSTRVTFTDVLPERTQDVGHPTDGPENATMSSGTAPAVEVERGAEEDEFVGDRILRP
jgi:hypothetical protein